MTVTEASPREAAVAATAAAVAWLEWYLSDGPRFSPQLRRDAVADGLQLPALHRAANELGVHRIQAGRWSRWSLKEHAEASAERRCLVCHEIKDREDFRRSPTAAYPCGRMLAVCGECTDRGAGSRIGTPAHIEAQEDRVASGAPDPAPAVRLRHELVTARRSGQSFPAAWGAAMATALATAAPREVDDWRDVLLETHAAWRSAFERTDAMATHGSLAMLSEAA